MKKKGRRNPRYREKEFKKIFETIGLVTMLIISVIALVGLGSGGDGGTRGGENGNLTLIVDKEIYNRGEEVILEAHYTGETATTVSFEVGYPNGEMMMVKTEDIVWGPGEWTKHTGNPVFDLGPSGSWDDEGVSHPMVLFDGTEYHMWYAGDDGSHRRIGYANSTDGITWTKHPSNPVLDLGTSGSWDDDQLNLPTVYHDGVTYHMWYMGHDGTKKRIGYANSTDGITWTKCPQNPVLDLGPLGAWDDDHVTSPTVLYDGSLYHMWYGARHTGVGTGYKIGYANSTDGITWTKYDGNPVLDLGMPGSWEDRYVKIPDVLYDGETYHMLYAGSDGTNIRIGYAHSTDRVVWIRSITNPVIDLGPSDSWDDYYVLPGTVRYDGIMYQTWYSGHDGSNYRVGYATAPNEGTARFTFTLPSDTPSGTYTVYASCVDGTANTTFKVTVPEIKIVDVTIPTEINPGEDVDFDILIENGFAENKDILVVLQVMNPNNEPLPPVYEYITVDAITTKLVTLTITLPSDSPVGTYLAQTQLLTEFPRNDGYALDYRNDNFEVT